MSDNNKDGFDTDTSRFEEATGGIIQHYSAGAEAISMERQEQLSKHGFSALHDAAYTDGQLKDAAMYLLTGNEAYWPKDWPVTWLIKFFNKSEHDKVVVAGALLAAEFDRLLAVLPKLAIMMPEGKVTGDIPIEKYTSESDAVSEEMLGDSRQPTESPEKSDVIVNDVKVGEVSADDERIANPLDLISNKTGTTEAKLGKKNHPKKK